MSKTSNFLKILLASFISQSGTHFLTLCIAAFVLVNSGSAVQSATVFVVSFLPSILVSAPLGHWIDKNISRTLLISNEIGSIFATVLCGLCIKFGLPLTVLGLILGARSICMFISRSGNIKWLKVISTPDSQVKRFKIYYLSFFLSTSVSGLLAAVILSHYSIYYIVTIDVFSYFLSILTLCTLSPISVPNSENLIIEPKIPLYETAKSIFSVPVTKASFLIVCFSQAVFQGSYSALISFLPVRSFNLGMSGIGKFQLAASIGITLGFLFNWFFPQFLDEKNRLFPKKTFFLVFIGFVFLLGSVITSDLATSILFFLLLNCSYECMWLHYNSEFFRASPKHLAASYQFTLSSSASFLMALNILVYSALIEWLGAVTGTLGMLSIFVMIAALSYPVSATETLNSSISGEPT